jgi:Transposase.
MGKKGNTMRRRMKQYTEEFRRQVVEELMTGPDSGNALSRKYGLSAGLLSHWCKRYEQAGEYDVEDDSQTLKTRVAELERKVGQLTMENDFLKKFAAFAKQQTNERMSIVTAKSLASRKPAGSLGLPAARTTTDVVHPAMKTPGSKNV